jgi:hypothetical protein
VQWGISSVSHPQVLEGSQTVIARPFICGCTPFGASGLVLVLALAWAAQADQISIMMVWFNIDYCADKCKPKQHISLSHVVVAVYASHAAHATMKNDKE